MPLPDLDTALLGGFRFSCRPDCGLCCFAEPAVTAVERSRLLTIEPELPIREGRAGWSFVASRTNGGACSLLADRRCRAHAVRPAPCAEFPVTVHVSDRAQATLVLSCPGLDPTGLDRWADGPPSSLPPTGLEGELRAARAEWDRTGSSKELARHRVRYRGRDSGGPIEAGRARLHHELPLPRAEDFPPEPPPEASGNLAELPLTFSESLGIVAFAGHPAGWSLHRFSEGGAEPVPLTVANPPDSLPGRTPGGDRRLRAYLHYLVERDDAFDTVLAGEAPPGPLVEHVAGDLVRTGATVLARAFVLQRLHGGHGPLDETDVWLGIRATDAEWLDRPTVGRRF